MSIFYLKHSGVVFLVAIDDQFLTTRDPSIIHFTINATESVRRYPACHSNFQDSQPALFDVQATAGESVGGLGLA